MTGPDGYCGHCRKMVPLSRVGRLIKHFTFWAMNLRANAPPAACAGWRPDNTITHYMDDPKAAFE